jgi:protein arginine N-methyltransferase 1
MTEWTVRTVAASEARFVLFPSMGEYPVYDGHIYDAFDAADDRHRAYRDAVRAVAHGKVVVDIGTGRDALWAIEAARAGAKRVYAIEADPAAAVGAIEAVAEAGLSDRVTILAGLSTQVTLPERAEVCVSEIIGNIATAEGAIAVLNDARRRLCTPTCTWIPFRAETYAAAVDLTAPNPPSPPSIAADDGLAVAAETLPYLRRIFAAAGGPFDLRLCLGGPTGDVIVSSAAPVESVVFERQPDPAATTTVELRVGVRAATVTGILLWTRLAATSRAGREVDALDGGTRAWAPVYVPLDRPENVTSGDPIRLTFTRLTSDDGIHPDYTLAVGDQPPWRSPHHGGPFRGSPFYCRLFTNPLRLS